MVDEGFILALITGLGVGGIVGAFFEERFRRRSQIELMEFGERLKRYRVVLIFMEALLNPEDIKHIPADHAQMYQIHDKKDVESSLLMEYSDMVFFAPDGVLRSVKSFMENPNSENYWKALIEIRRALWGKKTKLTSDDLKPHPAMA